MFLLLTVDIVCPVCAQTSVPFSEATPNFKIAFIGDQGLGKNAEAVLRLIKSEGAQAVLHQGYLDYENNPTAWEAQIDRILGADFPYFASQFGGFAVGIKICSLCNWVERRMIKEDT